MDLLLRRSHIKVGPVADWANDQHKSNGFLRHKAYESPESIKFICIYSRVLKTKVWYNFLAISLSCMILKKNLAIDHFIWNTGLFCQIIQHTLFALKKQSWFWKKNVSLPVFWWHSHYGTSKMLCNRQDLGEDHGHGCLDSWRLEHWLVVYHGCCCYLISQNQC